MSSLDTQEGAHVNHGLSTTRELHREEVNMCRTVDVQNRIGPLMSRVKRSLTKIQQLQDSIETKFQTRNSEEQGDVVGSDPDDKRLGAFEKKDTHKLLKINMGMLKRKLVSLQAMEDALQSSEDRRQNLQHYFIQTSCSKPQMELAAKRRRTKQLEKEVAMLEQEVRIWRKKSETADELQFEVEALTERLKDLEDVGQEIEDSRALISTYEEGLAKQEYLLEQERNKSDDLDVRIEELMIFCDEILKNLPPTSQETYRMELDEIVVQRRSCSEVHKSFAGSSGSASTASTDSDSDSSASDPQASIRQHAARPPTISGEASTSETLIQKLMRLERENAELREQQLENQQEIKALCRENVHQAILINNLQQRSENKGGKTLGAPQKEGRGSFFPKFRKSETKGASSS